ncbi:MAG: class I SAM-dependent methyltransferase [bacterium]|nr:class I SAM-dependent methyltransferase [bacterium]MDZ4285088.1 class I SAM-dependent methyltransferase [Patescibacteria group bacterium]
MDSREYWDNKIIAWEDSLSSSEGLSFVETLASKFRKPLKVRSELCLDILKKNARNKSVLELGCGSGYFAFRMRREAGPHSIVGVDVSRRAIERARRLQKELDITGGLAFIEGDANSIHLPKADITVGLGFLDYLTAEEIVALFKNLKSEYFVFTFSEKKFSLLRLLHMLYLISQRCPKHYYYTKYDMRLCAEQRHKDVRIISHHTMLFGCIIHNLPY